MVKLEELLGDRYADFELQYQASSAAHVLVSVHVSVMMCILVWVHVCVALPIVVGAWLMAGTLWQLFE